ncbi:hypothetical protein SLA2020_255610 [Shorea laevis]
MASSSTMLALCSSFSTRSKISHNQNPLSFPTTPSLFLSKPNSLKLESSPLLFTKPAFSSVPKFCESEGAVIEAEFDDKGPEPVQVVEATKEEPKREDVYAVVMVGPHQYIVFPRRYIHTHRLKGANVNDKTVLNKVLLLGTKTSTYIGEPIVTNAVVHACC